MSQPSGIGARVRTLRRREGLSQVSLAKVLGVSASYVNLIEHDRRRLPADLMFRLADALHVDVREFATDEVGTLRSELMAVLDHPVFEGTDVRAIDVKELAQQQPDIARALVLLYRRWRSSEEALEKLGSLVVGGAGLATEADAAAFGGGQRPRPAQPELLPGRGGGGGGDVAPAQARRAGAVRGAGADAAQGPRRGGSHRAGPGRGVDAALRRRSAVSWCWRRRPRRGRGTSRWPISSGC
jgi:transcriptional regulator with XRE-family HTH domain